MSTVVLAPPQQGLAVPEQAGDSLPQNDQKPSECWWELLASLRGVSNPAFEPGQLVDLLSRAWTEAQQDGQWNTSGIPELLRKSLEMAKRGSTMAATKYAVDLLAFRDAALKYRASARSADTPAAHSGGQDKKGSEEGSLSSGSTSSDVTSTQALPPNQPTTTAHVQGMAPNTADLNRANSDPLSPTSTSSGPSQQHGTTDAGVFCVPEPPSKRRRTSGPSTNSQEALRSSDSNAADKADVDHATQEWSGALGLMSEDGSRVSDLCHASLQMPDHLAHLMPRSLHFTHLVQRRGVMLGAYQVVRTNIKKANMRQMSRLRSMAQHELVAVASLPHLHLIVVPYQDNKGQLKLVSFALNC